MNLGYLTVLSDGECLKVGVGVFWAAPRDLEHDFEYVSPEIQTLDS